MRMTARHSQIASKDPESLRDKKAGGVQGP